MGACRKAGDWLASESVQRVSFDMVAAPAFMRGKERCSAPAGVVLAIVRFSAGPSKTPVAKAHFLDGASFAGLKSRSPC